MLSSAPCRLRVDAPVLCCLAAHFWLFPLVFHWLWSLLHLQGVITGSSLEEGKVGCWCAPRVPRWSWWASRNELCRRLSPGALERAHTEAAPAEEDKTGEKLSPLALTEVHLTKSPKRPLRSWKDPLENYINFEWTFFCISNQTSSKKS